MLTPLPLRFCSFFHYLLIILKWSIPENFSPQLIIRVEQITFASAQTFVYTEMFGVQDHAHKNCVLMFLSCTGAKMSAKMPFCQTVYKIQIRTNPQCLMSAIATFNLLFFKAIPCKSVQYWVPMPKLHAFHCGRAILGPSVT